MRLIGFSTGALAKGDFRKGIELQERNNLRAVELSALREQELEPLVEAISTLDVSRFAYLSFHAPGKLKAVNEERVIECLATLPDQWPIIVHPEIILTPRLWIPLGARVCIENMDSRKTSGRTADEMRSLFDLLPEASFCLDVGHARQIDPTMTIALMMLRQFGGRLRQVHVSEVGPNGEHMSIGTLATIAFRRIAGHIPEDCPLIIESVIRPDQMEEEIRKVSEAFDESKREELSAYAYA